MTWIKSALFFFTLAVLALPAIQKLSGIIPSKPLDGYFEPSPRPEFSFSALFSGDYQARLTPHLDRTIGFHNELTRLFNQVDYSCFSIPHAARVILGKNHVIQIDIHVDAYLGKDFAGRMYIDDKVARLQWLSDYLLATKNLRLLVIFTPGKGFFYPESIPDRFKPGRRGMTNNEYYARRLKEAGIGFIDFNEWMVQMKDSSKYSLYPENGAHWSWYGAFLCADSLVKYLETYMNRPLPRLVLDSMTTRRGMLNKEDDLDHVLNLIRQKPVPDLTFPVFHQEYNDTLPKPAALFISDSYYWSWQYSGFIRNTFQREEMWYYDKEVYPVQGGKAVSTSLIGLDSALSRQNIVVLMQTNAGYGDPGFGFVDRAYEYYFPGRTRVKMIEETLRNSPGWLAQMKEKAMQQGLPLDAVIRTDAIFLYNNELKRISRLK